jgi:hypothetical protein
MGFWTAVPLILLVPVRSWWLYVGGGILGVLPNLVRSVIYTGNPVFPALDGLLGPGWLSDGWNQANATLVGAPTYSGMHLWFWEKLIHRSSSRALFLSSVIALVAANVSSQSSKFRRELGFIFLQFVIALSVLKPVADARYAVPILAMLFCLGVASVFEVWPRFWQKTAPTARKRLKFASLGFLLIGLTVNIPLDALVKVPRDYLFKPRDRYLKAFHPLYSLHEAVNAAIPSGERVFFLSDKVNYYLNHDFESFSEMGRWERVLKRSNDAQGLVNEFKRAGYRYLVYYPEGSTLFAGLRLPPGMDDLKLRRVIWNKDFAALDLGGH